MSNALESRPSSTLCTALPRGLKPSSSAISPLDFELSAKESQDSHPRKTWVKRDSLEPLHQILHLISESIERDELETLVESIADSLGQDAFGRLAVALIQRARRD